MDTTATVNRVAGRTARREISEWWFVTGVTVFVLLITGLPYLYALLSVPADKQFVGIVLDAPDHAQYFSWMRELTSAPLAANKMTPEPNNPVFFNLLWWGMGRLGHLLGWGFGGMYQLMRLVAGALFLFLCYEMCRWFFKDRLMRRAAFLLITFTSGFGWVLVVLKYTLAGGQLWLPLDLYVAEGNTFLTIMGYPHFAAAALYVGVFYLVMRGQATKQHRYSLYAGLLALFVGAQHAYDLLTVYGVLFVFACLVLLRDRRLPRYLITNGILVGLISCGPAIYSTVLTTTDPLWKEVLKQFANAGVYTPNLLQLPILLGPAFLLALYTFVRKNPLELARADDNGLFLTAWFLTSFMLIYAPVDFQIHMINGWQVPIAILATQGLFDYVLPAIQRLVHSPAWSVESLRRAAVIALVVIVLPTNLYLWTWRFVELRRHDYPYFLYNDEVAAFHWLEANAHPDDVVLSSITIGQYVPAMTGTHAFLAHWAQTVQYYDKTAMVNEFYAGGTDDARRAEILRQYRVKYVFYGPAEQALGSYDVGRSDLLQLAFSSPEANVYEVKGNIR
jgi:hypothetical protein